MNNMNGDYSPTSLKQANRSEPMPELALRNYLSTQSIDSLLAKPETLAVLPFSTGSQAPACSPLKPGIIDTGLPLLGEDQSVNEVWAISGEEITRGSSGNCLWSKTESVICASIWLNDEQCQIMEEATFFAYKELLQLIQDNEFNHPFRFWNYLPEINRGEGDNEQYKLFCTGRLRAFKELKLDNEGFPSASALGNHAQGAVFFVFASKTKGLNINNALQVDAFNYPREYGVTSPSFSRATSIQLNNQDLFFISGTASIIGHKTTHEGDLKGQLQTTINNIKHLIDRKNQSQNNASLKSLKIYVRLESDLKTTRQYFEIAFPNTQKIYTLADICRSNLLIEAECFCE